jgi:hypothetical protein
MKKLHNLLILFKSNKTSLLLILGLLLVVIFYSCIVFSHNIHGDAKFHALYAKESAKSGILEDHQSFKIFDFSGQKRIYMPISYPLTSESFNTIVYTYLFR